MTQIKSDILYLCLSVSRTILEQTEAIQVSGAFKSQTMASECSTTLIDGLPNKQSPLCFGAALQCVCPLWWLMPTEDMYVRDTVETGPTKSHDWLFPLPVGGRDKHIPHRAWWDRLCAENGIVTKKAHFLWQAIAISPPHLLFSHSDKYS